MAKSTQAMANLHTAPFQSSVSGYPKIVFHSRAMHGILRDTTDVFIQVPRRGAETGGILLGRREQNAILIEDFAPVPSEHRFGRLYRLSELDRTRLREACESAVRHERGLEAVGLYRSNAREESGATDEDAEYVTDLLAEDRRLLLVVSPGVANPSFAGILILRDGHFEELLGTAPFPFEEMRVDSLAPSIEAPPVLAPAEPVNIETTEMPVPFPVRAPEPPPQEEPRLMARPFVARTFVEPEPIPTATKPPDITRLFPTPPVEPPSAPPEDLPRAEMPAVEPHVPQLLAPSATPHRSNKLVWGLAAAVAAAAITVGYLARQQQPPILEMTVAVPAPTAASQPSLAPAPAPERAETPAPPPQPAAPALAVENRDRQEPQRQPAEVRAVLDRWAEAIRRGRIEAAVSFYAPAARNDARARIRAMLGAAPRMDVFRISEMAVAFPAADQAVATLRENWQSGIVEKTAGEQGVRLTLRAQRDRWEIVSDQVEQVHWVQKIP